jgi:hypothetical protein
MILKLGPDTTVGNIKTHFNARFPFLKLEFGRKPHDEGSFIRHQDWYDDHCKISAIAKQLKPDYIVVRPWHYTGEIETLFRSQFGLYPQVFRQEGDKWFQTAGTDVFTLSEQNEAGKIMSRRARAFSYTESHSMV